MPAEIRIDLESLKIFIEETRPGAEAEHRSVHYLLRSLLQMGARWRDPPTVVLTVNDVEADFDEELQGVLDRLTGLEL